MNTRTWQYIGLGLVALFLVIQLVPGEPATNPPIETEVDVPAQVRTVLERSCFDCHSNETVWPWYSYVAPGKWIVRGHVAHAREEMNFSAWNRIPMEDRPHKWEEVAEEVEEGHMPLPGYLRLHPNARLSQPDMDLLIEFALARAQEMESAPRAGGEGDDEAPEAD